jgi:hypothetical protein
MSAVNPSTSSTHPLLRRLDSLVLVVLVLARIRIDSLAEAAVLPSRLDDVARHPFLGRLLPPDAIRLLAQQQLVDPIALLLIVVALGCLLAYLLVDEFVQTEGPRYRVKILLVCLIVTLTVFLPSLKLVLLRQQSGPASYSHDGGVIQTEATINYLLTGRNPYAEDYLNTPMAEWGINEFRTALYHYPYLPWTFIFSAPFKLLGQAWLGWYDQRFVYLLLFALTLALLPRLAATRDRTLLLVMLVGLNPIMGSDLIYGQNDSFVLGWIVLSLWLWKRGEEAGAGRGNGWRIASAAVFGLACASKPTAWFLAPFYLLRITRDAPPGLAGWLKEAWRRGWPALVAALLVIGPYFLWSPAAMIDDVWRWSAGTSPTAYQIWGWGGSNLVLAFGWVKSRFDPWPFWLPELLVGLPLMIVLLVRQWRENTLPRALWAYALFLFAFFLVSRFLNENYLGFIAAFLALGALVLDTPLQDLPVIAGQMGQNANQG